MEGRREGEMEGRREGEMEGRREGEMEGRGGGKNNKQHTPPHTHPHCLSLSLSLSGSQLFLRDLSRPSSLGNGSSDKMASEKAVKRLRRTPSPSPGSLSNITYTPHTHTQC